MTQIKKREGGVIVELLSELANSNKRVHRISSMLLDHLIMTLLIVPPLIAIMILKGNGVLEIEDGTFQIFLSGLMFLYLNKDFFKAKSAAKRIMGYHIINRKTHERGSEFQCFIRNLTIAIAWPLEVVISFMNPERRIGDFLANTAIVKSEKQKLNSMWADFKSQRLKKGYVGIVIIGIVYFYGLSFYL